MWSRANRARIEVIEAAGLLTPAGRAAVDEAKAIGAWLAIEHAEAGAEPADLRAPLDAEPAARRYWAAFPASTKRAMLEWIGKAKKPETRGRRIAETARLAARHSVARVGDHLYAFDDLCTCAEQPCPLSGGLLTGTALMCQCHGSRFDITTGAVINGPATRPLHVYDVQEIDGSIKALSTRDNRSPA